MIPLIDREGYCHIFLWNHQQHHAPVAWVKGHQGGPARQRNLTQPGSQADSHTALGLQHGSLGLRAVKQLTPRQRVPKARQVGRGRDKPTVRELKAGGRQIDIQLADVAVRKWAWSRSLAGFLERLAHAKPIQNLFPNHTR